MNKNFLIKIFFISLLLLSNMGYSQDYSNTIDSLKKVNSSHQINNNSKAKTLYNLSWYYYASRLLDSSVSYSKQALQFAANNRVDTVVNKSTVMLGAIYTMRSEYDSAAFYLNKGALYFESTLKTSYGVEVSSNTSEYEGEIAKIYSLLANVFSEQMKYKDAYIYYDKSENLYTKVKDTTGLIFNQIAKGNLFTNVKLYDKALIEYNNAINLSNSSGKVSNLSYVFNNVSTVYKKSGDKESAKTYLFKAINMAQQDKKIDLLGDAYHNLSLLYSDERVYDSALYYNSLSLAIFKKLNLLFRENSVHLSRCDYYLSQGELNTAKLCLDSIGEVQESLNAKYYLLKSNLAFKNRNLSVAIDFAQKALLFAKDNKNVDDQKNIYELLYKEYNDKHDFSAALKAYEKYIVLKDSVFNVEKSIAIQKVIVENIIEEKNTEIKLAASQFQEKQAKKDKLIWIAIAVIIGLLAILIIIYLMFKNQKHKTKISKHKIKLVEIEAVAVKRELEMELVKKDADKVKQQFKMELLKKESEEIKKEIIDFSLQSLKNKEFIELTRAELKNIKKSTSENSSINNLFAITNQFVINEQERSEFQKIVEGIQKSFFEKLDLIDLPGGTKLTKTEKKLAALLKLQLSSKEISSILNVSESSIEIYRSRLRKKLNIEQNISLTDYFNNI